MFAILGLPIGVFTAIEYGSPLAGLVGMITVVLVGLLVCKQDIIREYKDRKKATAKK
jgi:hypothetical protein